MSEACRLRRHSERITVLFETHRSRFMRGSDAPTVGGHRKSSACTALRCAGWTLL
ncbi:hypothetical protein A3768_5291 (plasmid) [Ralstonia solanacearum]|nr:hypothetical protein F504_4099 [Ralstonia pseudosolanacearum FQY_4]ANH36078.1 hypothetical protein A3768_5291 [Ralstonia solanacearum]